VDSTKKLQTLSLCTGYGGIERGLELAGEELNVLANVEIEAFAVANLVSKMEEGKLGAAPIWTDLKTLPAHVFRDAVDVLTGGYPCQPFSAAGKRQGADDPRHLWPHICRIIDEVRPRRCFFENVEGHISLGLREVLADLEARGYSTTWGIFSASEVGAPHQRKRVFILGDSSGGRSAMQQKGDRAGEPETKARVRSGDSRDEEMAHPNSERPQGGSQCGQDTRKTEERREGAHGNVGRIHNIPRKFWPARPGEDQHKEEAPRTIEPGLGGATHGTANRVDRLRLLGNGVVPQTAALAWRVLNA
jgi:DNA (cytosine-5)-methyltransferase 1